MSRGGLEPHDGGARSLVGGLPGDGETGEVVRREAVQERIELLKRMNGMRSDAKKAGVKRERWQGLIPRPIDGESVGGNPLSGHPSGLFACDHGLRLGPLHLGCGDLLRLGK